MPNASNEDQRNHLADRQSGKIHGAKTNKSSVVRDKNPSDIENLAWKQIQNGGANATCSKGYGPQITVSIKRIDVQTMSTEGKTTGDKIFITGAWKENVVEGNHLDNKMPDNDNDVYPVG